MKRKDFSGSIINNKINKILPVHMLQVQMHPVKPC